MPISDFSGHGSRSGGSDTRLDHICGRIVVNLQIGSGGERQSQAGWAIVKIKHKITLLMRTLTGY